VQESYSRHRAKKKNKKKNKKSEKDEQKGTFTCLQLASRSQWRVASASNSFTRPQLTMAS